MVRRTDASTGEIVETEPKVNAGGPPSMKVIVAAPLKTYFDGSAASVSAASDTGPFDILPRHHNFITLLTAGDLVIRQPSGGEQTFRISGGLMHVKADEIIVFLDV